MIMRQVCVLLVKYPTIKWWLWDKYVYYWLSIQQLSDDYETSMCIIG